MEAHLQELSIFGIGLNYYSLKSMWPVCITYKLRNLKLATELLESHD